MTEETGVYSIRNIVNEKRYVGSGAGKKGIGSRVKNHRKCLTEGKHPNRHLQASWNKYGSDAFVFEILEKCGPERCLEREQYWMDFYEVTNPLLGYNTCAIAGSVLGITLSEETREKMSVAQTGRKHTEEAKAKIGKANSENLKGRKQPPEVTAKIASANKGRKRSKEICEAMSVAQKKSWENREKIPGPMTGKKHSEASKAKMRQSWIKRKEKGK